MLSLFRNNGNTKLGKRVLVGLGGTLGHKLGCVLYLGECDNVTNILKTEKQGHETVKSEGKSTVRGNAVLERVKEIAEFFLCLCRGKSENLEHLGLYRAVVDTDRSSAKLGAVKNDVVSLSANSAGIAVNVLKILVHGRGKGMVHCVEAAILLAVLEKRKFGYPKELEIKEQDLMNCFTVYEFTVPTDIDVKSNGKSEVLVGFTTGITGADAYFYDLQLYSSNDDSKTNLFVNSDFELGLYGWTGTSYNYKPETEFGVKVFRYKEEAELLPYDASIFVNDLNDEFFDDGDWASEYGNDYTMSEWLKKIGFGSDKEISNENPISQESNNIYWIIIPIVCGLILIGGASVIIVKVLKKKKKV